MGRESLAACMPTSPSLGESATPIENSPPGSQTIPVGACLGAGAVFGTVGPKPLVAVTGEGAAAAPDELLVAAPWLVLTVSTGFRAHEAPTIRAKATTPTRAVLAAELKHLLQEWIFGFLVIQRNLAKCRRCLLFLQIVHSLRQDNQLGLTAAAHPVSGTGIESSSVVFVTTRRIGLHRDLSVCAADNRIIGIEGIVGAERDHEASVLVGGHPDNLGALLNTEELIVLGIGNAGSHIGRVSSLCDVDSAGC